MKDPAQSGHLQRTHSIRTVRTTQPTKPRLQCSRPRVHACVPRVRVFVSVLESMRPCAPPPSVRHTTGVPHNWRLSAKFMTRIYKFYDWKMCARIHLVFAVRVQPLCSWIKAQACASRVCAFVCSIQYLRMPCKAPCFTRALNETAHTHTHVKTHKCIECNPTQSSCLARYTSRIKRTRSPHPLPTHGEGRLTKVNVLLVCGVYDGPAWRV